MLRPLTEALAFQDESRKNNRMYFLFTMFDNPLFCALRIKAKLGFGRCIPEANRRSVSYDDTNSLVEPDGIEPTTSCLQSTRSPN